MAKSAKPKSAKPATNLFDTFDGLVTSDAEYVELPPLTPGDPVSQPIHSAGAEEPKKPTSDWRSLIKVHPAADFFPLLPSNELKDLAEDIKANGLTFPTTAWRDPADRTAWLLDGRNRLDALVELGYRFSRHGRQFLVHPPEGRCGYRSHQPFGCFYEGLDPVDFIESANLHRRHLTTAQKRDLVEKLLKAQPERSDRATAKLAKVHNETVAAQTAAEWAAAKKAMDAGVGMIPIGGGQYMGAGECPGFRVADTPTLEQAKIVVKALTGDNARAFRAWYESFANNGVDPERPNGGAPVLEYQHWVEEYLANGRNDTEPPAQAAKCPGRF